MSGAGLDPGLANQVATQLMAKDALGAHARDELGISEILSARPVQAALASATTFAVGAAMPLLLVLFVPASALGLDGFGRLLILSCALGCPGGPCRRVTGYSKSAARATFWGALAMALTAGVGALFGATL